MKYRRSLFGPLVLIAIGILWLMSNMGRIEPANFWALTYVFPYAIILLGLGLILRAYWSWAGEVVSVLVVVLGVVAVIYAPQLGWARMPASGNFPFFMIGPGKAATGEVIKVEPSVKGFDSIEIAIPAEVVITQGASEALTIEAQSDVLDVLQTKVNGSELYIGYPDGNWNKYVMPTETVRINITVKDLNSVTFSTAGKLDIEKLETDSLSVVISGAGDLVINNLSATSLECVLSGAGSLRASGNADRMDLRLSGMGSFDATDLKTQSANVRISGAGSADIWVVDELDVTISGAGSVSYYGKPSVSKTVSGVGSVNARGDK